MIDDKSRYVHVYFIKSKSEVLSVFKIFVKMVDRQTGCKLKTLRSDNGTEYVNIEFDDFLKHHGIKRQLTVPYTPQQNGVAERFNRTLVEMARTMLVSASIDEAFWAEAIACAAYLRNRSPTRVLVNSTPYEMWTGRKPVVKHLKVFGSTAVALDKTQNKKFRSKGKEYTMVGYSETAKAYRLYDKTKRDVILSRDVYFIENYESKEVVNVEDTILNNSANEAVNVEQPDLCKSDGTEATSNESEYETPEAGSDSIESPSVKFGRGRPKILRTGEKGRPKKQKHVITLLQTTGVITPMSVEEAMSTGEAGEWKAAMQEEYQALVRNDTWDVVDLPQNHKAIGCKWVFSLKKNACGAIERFKARLVAKGCNQKFGINYTETYSPVVRYATIRMVLALAAEHQLHVHQLDVSTAYLNGDLHVDVYMAQPENFDDESGRVLKLKKSLYGLKQSGRIWNEKLDTVLKKMGYKACESEPCLYTKTSKTSTNIIAVYVDDLLIACSNVGELNETKRAIANVFQIVDKGPVHHFLGLEIEREGDTGAIFLGQKQHINNVLKEFSMSECRSAATPLEVNYQINCTSDECETINTSEYQSIIGSLMYIAISSRPDILHSVCKLSQRNANPHKEHLVAAKHVLRYLKATSDMKIKYMKTGEAVKGYVDADWAGDPSDRKSFTGYAFFLAGAAFSWECKNQASVALSSTEAEYMALSAAAKEAVYTYLRKLFNEINLHYKLNTVDIYGDNLGATNIVKDPIYYSKSKHIDVRHHHIRECYEKKLIELKYCASKDMIADVYIY